MTLYISLQDSLDLKIKHYFKINVYIFINTSS